MTVLYVVLGLIVLFFVFQYAMIFKMRRQKGKAAPELSGRYGKAIRGRKKALFYFYSDACRACKPMTPLIERYQRRNKNIFKVDIASDMATARKFGVMGTPSLVVVEGGVIQEFIVGPQPEARIKALVA